MRATAHELPENVEDPECLAGERDGVAWDRQRRDDRSARPIDEVQGHARDPHAAIPSRRSRRRPRGLEARQLGSLGPRRETSAPWALSVHGVRVAPLPSLRTLLLALLGREDSNL